MSVVQRLSAVCLTKQDICLPFSVQELEKLEVERIEWIQQHLRQYTTLRHETDMFNQSVSLWQFQHFFVVLFWLLLSFCVLFLFFFCNGFVLLVVSASVFAGFQSLCNLQSLFSPYFLLNHFSFSLSFPGNCNSVFPAVF